MGRAGDSPKAEADPSDTAELERHFEENRETAFSLRRALQLASPFLARPTPQRQLPVVWVVGLVTPGRGMVAKSFVSSQELGGFRWWDAVWRLVGQLG